MKHDEAKMRAETAPTPKTIGELTAYIDYLADGEHDYGTCVYATSLAAVAAFNHVAHRLCVSGFQAMCADLDVVRRTRSIDGPFALIRGRDMLYPQYDALGELQKLLEDEWRGWAAKEAQKMLIESPTAHSDVVAHWRKLADYALLKDSKDPKDLT